jgi:L-amino acid N-acyltransferase YncA
MAASSERRLADGRAIRLRRAGEADVPAITMLYLELSPESFRRRFYTERPSPALVARFASLGSGTVCVVAAAPGSPNVLAAEARAVPLGPGTAELALTVDDRYQGAGLGRLLLDALITHARQDGIERLRATVLLSNTPMLRLLQRYGWVLAGPTEEYSETSVEISAVGGMPAWPADSAGRRVLVERRSWFDDAEVAALRSAGMDVRQCTGPLQHPGRACPLISSGLCRIAEEADLIVARLPADEFECAAVLAAHRRRWPAKLGQGGS